MRCVASTGRTTTRSLDRNRDLSFWMTLLMGSCRAAKPSIHGPQSWIQLASQHPPKSLRRSGEFQSPMILQRRACCEAPDSRTDEMWIRCSWAARESLAGGALATSEDSDPLTAGAQNLLLARGLGCCHKRPCLCKRTRCWEPSLNHSACTDMYMYVTM